MELTRKLQINEHNGQAVITVPIDLVRSKNWKDGQEIKYKINKEGNLELSEA
jgi:hypothetical protein